MADEYQDLSFFFADCQAEPRRGFAPLGVQFQDRGPYDIIVEVASGYNYVIVEQKDSKYVIIEMVR